jgi:hypothetical protein
VRALIAAATVALVGCAGAGEGEARGTLTAPGCGLEGAYDLRPTFFGANRTGPVLSIRIQRGGGPADFTDHLLVVLEDTDAIAARLASSNERDSSGQPVVTLPVGPSGAENVLVHAFLAPNQACGHTNVTELGQNVGLPAYAGSITFRRVDVGDGARAEAAGNRERLTDVPAFQFHFLDPRPMGPAAPEGVSPDTPVGSAELSGWFRFSYSRRPPAQEFFP